MFQSRQPVFVKLLQHAFRVSDCPWLTGTQKYHVETCIKCLADIGKVVHGLIKGLSNLSFVCFLKILTLSSSMKRGIKFWNFWETVLFTDEKFHYYNLSIFFGNGLPTCRSGYQVNIIKLISIMFKYCSTVCA